MADVVAEVKVADASAEIEKEVPVEKEKEKVVEKEAPQEKVVENGTSESETTKEEVKEEESEDTKKELNGGSKVNGDATKEESCPVLKRKSEGAATEAAEASETDGVSPQKKPKLDESVASQNGDSQAEAEATA